MNSNEIKRKMIRFPVLMLFVSALTMGCDYGYDDWDANNDDVIDENEFAEGFGTTRHYSGWDVDGDGYLNDDEFYEGTFGLVDYDNDNYLTEDEWSILDENFNDEFGVFTDWDSDRDELVNKDEFIGRMGENDSFQNWDADQNNTLSEDEFAAGVFDRWDDNDDNRIDPEEYDRWEADISRSSDAMTMDTE